MKKILALILIIVVVCAMLLFFLILPYLKSPTYATPQEGLYSKILDRTLNDGTPYVQVKIKNGDQLDRIAEKLYQVGLIQTEWFFKLYTKWTGDDEQLKFGYHLFHSNMDVDAILTELKTPRPDEESPEVEEIQVTIPEGKDVFEVAQILQSAGLVKEDTFLEHCLNSSLPNAYDIPEKSVEGFLFPETYRFYVTASEETIIKRMMDEFFKRYSQTELIQAAQRLQLKRWMDVVTLASLVEKEVGYRNERQMVANLYWSRYIHHRMNFECDPTAVYAIKLAEYRYRDVDLSVLESCRPGKRVRCDCARGHFPDFTTNPAVIYHWRLAKDDWDGKIAPIIVCRKPDGRLIDWDSVNEPHNTYVDRPFDQRMPPTPICNPGAESLHAAMNASFTEYRYFVADGTGGSNFATNRQEHSENVSEYRRKMRKTE